MTRSELQKLVPIRRLVGSAIDVVAFSDIPEPWRVQFFIAMAGQRLAKSDEALGPCAHADDWLRWVDGRLPSEPTGLEDS